MRYYTLLCCLWLTWSGLVAQGPVWQAELDAVTAGIENIEANGRSFDQTLSLTEGGDELIFNTTITEKNGKSNEERFEFNLLDLDVRLLRREVKSKVMYLSVKTSNSQRMIKYFKNGEQENYRNLFMIAVNDAEAYRGLSDAFESLIKASKKDSKLDFSGMDFNQQLAFLKENIVSVKSDEDTYDQELVIGEPAYFVQVKTNHFTDKDNTASEAHLNLADLQGKSIKINVSGKKLQVRVGTKSNNRWIKNYEEGEFKSYSNSLEVLVNTTNEARNISGILKELITTARKMEKERFESLAGDASQRQEKLLSYVKDTKSGKGEYTQELAGDCVLQLTRESLAEKGSSAKEVFSFNLIDFEKKSATISSSASSLSVTLKSKDRMIQHLRDGELQSYRNSVEFYVDEVENAKVLSYLLSEQIGGCEGQASGKTFEGQTKEQLFEKATALILDVELSSYTYRQKLATEEGETCKLQFTQIKSTKNKDTEIFYDFSLSDINPKTIDFAISGKNLSLQLATRNNEKVIKEYKGNDDSDYTNRLQIYMDDVEETRLLIGLLTELTAQCADDGN